MPFNISALPNLALVLLVIALLQVVAAVFSYFVLPTIKAKEKLFRFFASYLMIVLSLDLLLIHILQKDLTNISLSQFFLAFLTGFIILFFTTIVHNAINHKQDHLRLGFLLFLILALHEVTEAAAISEIFSNPTIIPTVASLIPLIILTIHEIPEGVLLVLPFFLAKQAKLGVQAVLLNQIIFFSSGIIFFKFFILVDFEALLATILSGGLFYLGISEFLKALKSKEAILVVPKISLGVFTIFVLLATFVTFYLTNFRTEQKTGEPGFVVDHHKLVAGFPLTNFPIPSVAKFEGSTRLVEGRKKAYEASWVVEGNVPQTMEKILKELKKEGWTIVEVPNLDSEVKQFAKLEKNGLLIHLNVEREKVPEGKAEVILEIPLQEI